MKQCLAAALAAGIAALAVESAWAQAPARPATELRCASHGQGPLLDCTVRLRSAAGAALDGAQVTLGATMPSMPMAHSVKPVPAKPTGQPGEYRGTLELEMLGVWAVQVDIAGPVRDRVVRPLANDECQPAMPCSAAPARAGAAHKH
jgi:hypothetical protein